MLDQTISFQRLHGVPADAPLRRISCPFLCTAEPRGEALRSSGRDCGNDTGNSSKRPKWDHRVATLWYCSQAEILNYSVKSPIDSLDESIRLDRAQKISITSRKHPTRLKSMCRRRKVSVWHRVPFMPMSWRNRTDETGQHTTGSEAISSNSKCKLILRTTLPRLIQMPTANRVESFDHRAQVQVAKDLALEGGPIVDELPQLDLPEILLESTQPVREIRLLTCTASLPLLIPFSVAYFFLSY